jgi:hypothetical protein
MNNLFKTLNILLLMSALFVGINPLWSEEKEENAKEEEAVEETEAKEETKVKKEIRVPPRGGTGYVEVSTTPEKAKAYLDGEELGLTPVAKRPFRSGRFDFTIMYGGEELINERVNIWADQTTTIEKDLVMPYGTIILTTIPGYTRVSIDDEDLGRTSGGPLTINNVTSGTHILKVSAKGRRSREIEVTVDGEDTTRVSVKLAK